MMWNELVTQEVVNDPQLRAVTASTNCVMTMRQFEREGEFVPTLPCVFRQQRATGDEIGQRRGVPFVVLNLGDRYVVANIKKGKRAS
jgi:hypothetical protein